MHASLTSINIFIVRLFLCSACVAIYNQALEHTLLATYLSSE